MRKEERNPDSRVKWADGVRFCTNEIRKTVGGRGIDKAIANPFSSFHATFKI